MLLILSLLYAFTSAKQTPPHDALTRPCKAIVGADTGTEKPRATKKKRGKQENPAPARNCVEVRLSALDAQEYLQRFIREQQWSVADEQAGEDAWTFTIYLDKEKLARYTKPFADPLLRWRSGKALVQVRTTEQKQGYTQVFISARFDGYGESEDTFAVKRESWPMESSGILESTLTSALESHVNSSR